MPLYSNHNNEINSDFKDTIKFNDFFLLVELLISINMQFLSLFINKNRLNNTKLYSHNKL